MRTMVSSFLELVRLQSEMNKLFEALQHLQSDQDLGEVGFATPYDILEAPDAILVEVDLPGVDPASLQVEMKGHDLVIRGEHERTPASGIVAYHLMERSRGPFTRRLQVEGAVDSHKASATYGMGVLTIRLPRLPERRGRVTRVPVQVKG